MKSKNPTLSIKIFKILLLALIGIGVINLFLVSGLSIKISSKAKYGQSNINLVPDAKALECSFEQASCSWDPVIGAVSYNLTITEEDSGSVIKNEQVPGTTNRITFPVIQGKTYRCDVAAINDCGAVGITASQSLLCEVEGFAQNPPPPPVAPPPPPVGAPSPTPTPTPTPLACGYAPCNEVTAPCQAGLVCVTGNNGTKICTNPAYQTACAANPNGTTCCTAPVVKPPPPQQLPPAGSQELTYAIGIFSTTLVILGILGFMIL